MNMDLLKGILGKSTRNIIRSERFENLELKILLKVLEEKRLQCFLEVKRMDITRKHAARH
jgi:hypothetical protein